jgi:hypothetical protein
LPATLVGCAHIRDAAFGVICYIFFLKEFHLLYSVICSMMLEWNEECQCKLQLFRIMQIDAIFFLLCSVWCLLCLELGRYPIDKTWLLVCPDWTKPSRHRPNQRWHMSMAMPPRIPTTPCIRPDISQIACWLHITP